VAWSDLLQGLMMIVGLVTVPLLAVIAVGGFPAVGESLAKMDPSLVSLWGKRGLSGAGVLSALSLFSIGWGYLGSPQIFVRFMAVRRSGELIPGALVAVLFNFVAGTGAIMTGLAGKALYGTLDDSERVFPLLVNDFLPAILAGVFLAVVLAAIMSTADSLLLVASSTIVRDLYQKVFRPDRSGSDLTRLCRNVTILIAIVGLLVALQKPRVLFWFILRAWGGIAASFCPVVILSLFWKRLTRPAAISSMVCGAMIALLWPLLGWDESFLGASQGLYEMVPAFLGSLIVAFVVSFWSSPPPQAVEDLDEAKRMSWEVWR